MTEEILQVNENFSIDESIEKYQFAQYNPIAGTNLNNPGEIIIFIENQSVYFHPSKSYLLIEGKLVKTDDSPFTNADIIALCNNGIMYLFNNIKYELTGQEIESVNYPGRATTMLGVLKYSDGFSRRQGLNLLWSKDSGSGEADLTTNERFAMRHDILIKSPDQKGKFSFMIPLKHIFGFAEDYEKVVYGFQHQLTLYRNANADAIFKKADAVDGNIILEKVAWRLPYVKMADEQRYKMFKMIESKSTFKVGFRARKCFSISVPMTTSFTWQLGSQPEKPRWVIVGFQTNKNLNQNKNAAIFDNLDLKDICVVLGGTVRYPELNYNISFPNQQFSTIYEDAINFSLKFNGLDDPNISPKEYKELYPLFVFDLCNQDEQMKNTKTELTIYSFFNKDVPVGTQAYALIISDKILRFQSDGNKMSVVMG